MKNVVRVQVLPWFWNGHVETIFAALTRKNPRLDLDRRLVELEDGGVVAIDFEPMELQQVTTTHNFCAAVVLSL